MCTLRYEHLMNMTIDNTFSIFLIMDPVNEFSTREPINKIISSLNWYILTSLINMTLEDVGMKLKNIIEFIQKILSSFLVHVNRLQKNF